MKTTSIISDGGLGRIVVKREKDMNKTPMNTTDNMNIELWRYIMRLQSQNNLTPSEAKHLAFWQATLGI